MRSKALIHFKTVFLHLSVYMVACTLTLNLLCPNFLFPKSKRTVKPTCTAII